MKSTDFRKELHKIMPGYKWTISRDEFILQNRHSRFEATGIQSAGFSRISTLKVIYTELEYGEEYEVKSSGFGKNSGWLHSCKNGTLKRALRDLQNHYDTWARAYKSHAEALQAGRIIS